jgi:hypothetical protein
LRRRHRCWSHTKKNPRTTPPPKQNKTKQNKTKQNQQKTKILVNGPGTCIPVCGAAFVLRVLGLLDVRIAYVESIARVERLSLSGTLLRGLRMADLVLVQWQEMVERYPRTVCAGRLY